MIDFKINLENNFVSLVQTQEEHFEELYKVGNNPDIWKQHLDSDRWKLNNFRKYIDGGLNNNEGCFSIIDKKINELQEFQKDGSKLDVLEEVMSYYKLKKMLSAKLNRVV